MLNTYIVNFTLKAPTSDVEGAQLTPQFKYTEINGEKYYDTNVTVENMPASGYIKVVFDRTMQSVTLPFTDEANNLNETLTAEQGKEPIFYYWNIPNKELNYVLPGSMFKDIYGKEFAGKFEKHFIAFVKNEVVNLAYVKRSAFQMILNASRSSYDYFCSAPQILNLC